MITLGIDPGNTTGWAVAEDGEIFAHGTKTFPSEMNKKAEKFVEFISFLIEEYRPDKIGVCKPWGGRRNIYGNQMFYIGACYGVATEKVCAHLDVPMRLKVLGCKDKETPQKHFKTKTDHESDACVAAIYVYQKNK